VSHTDARAEFKQVSKLIGLTLGFGLLFRTQLLLAAEPTDFSKLFNNSATRLHRLELILKRRSTRLEIKLSRYQLNLYQGKNRVASYPIAVGRRGWETPTGNFRVLQMIQHPSWMNPFTKEVILGGKHNNPLGDYWIGFWTDGKYWFGMHGTPNPDSVGKAASHGCIRMYNRDIQELFAQVSPGTPITVLP